MIIIIFSRKAFGILYSMNQILHFPITFHIRIFSYWYNPNLSKEGSLYSRIQRLFGLLWEVSWILRNLHTCSHQNPSAVRASDLPWRAAHRGRETYVFSNVCNKASINETAYNGSVERWTHSHGTTGISRRASALFNLSRIALSVFYELPLGKFNTGLDNVDRLGVHNDKNLLVPTIKEL